MPRCGGRLCRQSEHVNSWGSAPFGTAAALGGRAPSRHARAGSTAGRSAGPPRMDPPLLLALFSARCLEFQRSNARPLPLLRLQSWLPARKHVQEALDQRKEVHPSGEARGWFSPLFRPSRCRQVLQTPALRLSWPSFRAVAHCMEEAPDPRWDMHAPSKRLVSQSCLLTAEVCYSGCWAQGLQRLYPVQLAAARRMPGPRRPWLQAAS